MKTLYTGEYSFDRNSIFLAGPTPRSPEVKSWRPEALDLLIDYPGTVFVPEYRNEVRNVNYTEQVEWEYHSLHLCEYIIFWVPRKMDGMPALTTNVEFGYYIGKYPDKCLYGRPNDAENIAYLDWLYQKETGRAPATTLYSLLRDL